MSPKAVFVLLGVFGVAVLASAEAPVPEPRLPESFEWFSPPGISGLKAAWVVGAEQESGLYALRVRLVQGTRIAPHTHPDTRYSTVLSGTLYVGFGGRWMSPRWSRYLPAESMSRRRTSPITCGHATERPCIRRAVWGRPGR